MKLFCRGALFFAALISVAGPVGAQIPPGATPPPAADPKAEVKLEDLPAKLVEIDQEMTKYLSAYLAVVEKEAKAKRLSAAYAQSLRWSGKTAVEGSFGASARTLMTTVRTPIENHAVSEARDILDTAIEGLALKRKALLFAVGRALHGNVAEAMHGNPTIADLKALGDRIDAARDLVRNRVSASTSDELIFSSASNAVRWLQRLCEAAATQDAEKLRDALPVNTYVGDLIPEGDRKARSALALHPFTAAVEAAQTALQTALETGRPRPEREAALAQLEEAAQPLNVLSRGYSLPEVQAATPPIEVYRAILRGLAALDGGDTEAASNAFSEVRSMSHEGARWTVWVNAQVAKWQAGMGDVTKRIAEDRRTKMRAQLAAVKTPADLEALIGVLGSLPSNSRHRDEDEAGDLRGLKEELVALSAAWTSADIMTFQRYRYGGSQPGRPFSKEIAALRTKVEHEVLARTLHAPELTQAPLADLPPEGALEKLGDDLARRGEWRRLCQLLEGQSGIFVGGMAAAQQDLLKALQSFLAGQNFEQAEQWRDAIASYKEVLRSTSEQAPTVAAADRLKILTKAHPDTAVPRPSPAPASPKPLPLMQRGARVIE